ARAGGPCRSLRRRQRQTVFERQHVGAVQRANAGELRCRDTDTGRGRLGRSRQDAGTPNIDRRISRDFSARGTVGNSARSRGGNRVGRAGSLGVRRRFGQGAGEGRSGQGGRGRHVPGERGDVVRAVGRPTPHARGEQVIQPLDREGVVVYAHILAVYGVDNAATHQRVLLGEVNPVIGHFVLVVSE